MSAIPIPGVSFAQLDVHEDDRGDLFEALHDHDPWVGGAGQSIRQVYVVRDPVRYVVRAFHAHVELHDWFCIVAGSAVFALVDGRSEYGILDRAARDGGLNAVRDGAEPHGPTWRGVLTARRPALLAVPPGVFHGWMALEDGTVLLSGASHVYDRANPDEVRVPPDRFDGMFGSSPWWVRGR